MTIFKMTVDAPILIHYFSKSYHCNQPPGFRSTDATPPPPLTGNLPGHVFGTRIVRTPTPIQTEGTEEPRTPPDPSPGPNFASVLCECPFDPFSRPGIWGQVMLVPGRQAAQILSFR